MSVKTSANVEPVGERPCFRTIVVADRDELRAAHLAEHRQVRQLRDRARAHDANPNRVRHRSWFRVSEPSPCGCMTLTRPK